MSGHSPDRERRILERREDLREARAAHRDRVRQASELEREAAAEYAAWSDSTTYRYEYIPIDEVPGGIMWTDEVEYLAGRRDEPRRQWGTLSGVPPLGSNPIHDERGADYCRILIKDPHVGAGWVYSRRVPR